MIIILFNIFNGIGKNHDYVKNGTIDVTNIENASPIELSGTWEFYWNELLSSNGEILDKSEKQMVQVPAYNWSQYKDKQGNKLPYEGYGTYRLLIKANINQRLAIKLPQISTSYNLWINGKLYFSSGKVGGNKKLAEPKWTTNVVNFTAEKNINELELEVCNFSYYRSGITLPIIIGSEGQIQKLKYSGLFTEAFISALLFGMSIFFFMFYIIHSRSKQYAYLALYALAIAIRPLLYGECYFNYLFPNISFDINTKIYLIDFVAIQLFFLYFYYQYEELLNRNIVRASGIALGFIIFIGILLPVKYMIYSAYLCEINNL